MPVGSRVPAGKVPSIAYVDETRPRGVQGSSRSAVGPPPFEQPLDDWLGEVSDEDWSEDAPERVARQRAAAQEELPGPEDDLRRAHTDERSATRSVATADARRAVIERRRLVAVIVVATAIALAVAIPVLLLRGGDPAAVTPAPETSTTTTITTTPTTETGASSPPATTSPSTSTTPQTTAPSPGGTPAFALPEGTKLQLGENDPAVVRELQRALSRAGFDPGSADGTFGPLTEAAVVAFQQANGLSVDGRVGPETAAALNSALESG